MPAPDLDGGGAAPDGAAPDGAAADGAAPTGLDAPSADHAPPPVDRAPSPPDIPPPAPPDAAADRPAPPPDAAPDASGSDGCPESRGGPTSIRVNGFCIDATEVTNGEYLAFWMAKSSGSDTTGQLAVCAWNDSFTPDGGGGARWPPEPGRERRPVVNVDWCDAQAFCQWAGKRLCGRIGGGSLSRWQDTTVLSISQWTYACTSGGATTYPYGSSYDPGACNAERPVANASQLVDVGSKAGCRTDRGVHDLSGNVEEWADACTGAAGASDACAVVGASAFHKTPHDLSCAGSPYPDRRASRYELRGFRCCAP